MLSDGVAASSPGLWRLVVGFVVFVEARVPSRSPFRRCYLVGRGCCCCPPSTPQLLLLFAAAAAAAVDSATAYVRRGESECKPQQLVCLSQGTGML